MCLQIMQTLNGGGVLGPLYYKLITIVNCYLKTGLTCFVYCPKASHICSLSLNCYLCN